MKQYFRLNTDGKVVGMFSLEDEDIVDLGDDLYVENPTPFPPGWPTGSTPTEELYWLNDSITWVETATLADLKAVKNAEINAARLSANRSYFVFAGKQIACDELSRSDIDAINGIVALIGGLPPNWVGGWKAIDNTYVVISDKATWISFYSAMVQRGTDNFNHAQNLKTTLAAATTASAIDSISWN